MADDQLRRVLGELQRRGASGPTDLDAAIRHAAAFVDVLPPEPHRVIDLGSGGGLPGLVIAVRRPDVDIVLVERRTKRADLLRYAVRALDLEAHVVVTEVDALRLRMSGVSPARVVTARSFGSPRAVMAVADDLVEPGGTLVVSEPPDRPQRWAEVLEQYPAFADAGLVGGVQVIRRSASI